MSLEKKEKLGEILIKAGLLSETQLRSGLAYQRQWGIQLGEALVTLGFLTEVELLKVLARQLHIPAVNLAKTYVSDETLKLIKSDFAKKHSIIPLGKRITKGQEILLVATSDPTNLSLLDEIRFIVNLPVHFVIATRSSLNKAIKKFYFKEKVDFVEVAESRIAKIKKMKDEDFKMSTNDTSRDEPEFEISPEKLDTPLTMKQELSKQDTLATRIGISKELQALVKLLIKKGYISRTEYINELKKL